ncbi:hypothetical protein PHYSODRAFT_508981 [Phytophthora sojae]|uniref:Uncharacterized protein n=1 Tax=Phytophthora sojae (strain P6497) TaxID=1094619 RepID=G4ZNJ0_PHYSP|nr:hypothetical protein PHYSODRAFT_506832 [Phytophthora sojae]XP_009528516.1 hypothetical protein PHYSODRAFT_508981 [Phytophthora sojae]EGZ14719.1 hypothetical protein PHYSODRAFT_506832 [Phytophthora sojae]EGZ14767.1 hypothetical protein PHYSODRAFT_508981 [Phytophthora sojae]|eukprot:XP_009528468.1 hypothetical protein PHYSODRAFT_506832 [Phytophthora sojae]
MAGLYPRISNYTEYTGFGVASVLCGLGLRWRFNASRSVSYLMGTLAYLLPECDKLLAVNSSNLVLALIAMRLWYTWGRLCVFVVRVYRIRLLVLEGRAVHNVNKLVACIVLLLVIGKCSCCRIRGKITGHVTFEVIFDTSSGKYGGLTGSWDFATSFGCNWSLQKKRCGICLIVALLGYFRATEIMKIL